MMSPTSEVKPSQVAQLMKENAELKEKLAEHEESWWLLWSDADDDYKAVLAENKKLKAENEKLQNDFQKGYDEGLEEHVVDKEYLDEKEEEIDKLKQRVCDRNTSLSIVKEENAKLKAEIAKLTKRNDIINLMVKMVKEDMITEITQAVQEENAKLKEKCGKWRDKFMILEDSAKKHLGTGFNDYKQ